MAIEAVKFERGAEVDWLDPVTKITFSGDSFVIHTNRWDYEQPIAEFDSWKFRTKPTPPAGEGKP